MTLISLSVQISSVYAQLHEGGHASLPVLIGLDFAGCLFVVGTTAPPRHLACPQSIQVRKSVKNGGEGTG
jgi:hypothetical protein